jgi:hypothetical protein
MSNTYTPAIALAMPASGDRTWNVALNANAAALDALNPVGDLAVTGTEFPSATLNVRVAPGVYVRQDGTVATYAGVSSVALTAAATNYLFLDLTTSGTLIVNTTGFPTTSHVRLAVGVTGGAAVTSIADARVAFTVCGSIADGVNLTFGTTTGTQIGTTTTGKIGFFGKTPIVQPTVGAAVAGATYTAAEQAILNAVVAAVRGLGLGRGHAREGVE